MVTQATLRVLLQNWLLYHIIFRRNDIDATFRDMDFRHGLSCFCLALRATIEIWRLPHKKNNISQKAIPQESANSVRPTTERTNSCNQ